jgi:periplasmic divalent cation tolerance protein
MDGLGTTQSSGFMQSAQTYAVVLVTAPNLKTARQLARMALEARLVACANLVPKIESHYWWQGKIESSPEVLILLKTSASLIERLENLILSHHPYETPEIVTLSLSKGTQRYLSWLGESVKNAG